MKNLIFLLLLVTSVFSCPVVDSFRCKMDPIAFEPVQVTFLAKPTGEDGEQVIDHRYIYVDGSQVSEGQEYIYLAGATDHTVTGVVVWHWEKKLWDNPDVNAGPISPRSYAKISKNAGDNQIVPKNTTATDPIKAYLYDWDGDAVNSVSVNFSEGTTTDSATSDSEGIATTSLDVSTAIKYSCEADGGYVYNSVTFDETVFSIEITSPTERKYIARPVDGQTTEFDVTYSIKPEGFTASRGYLYLTDSTGGGSMGDLDPLSGEGRMTCSVSSDDKLDNYKLSAKVYSDQNLEAKSSNNQTITIFGITTETEATVPIDRSRKKIGVGEKVILTFEPTGLGSVKWSMTGEGAILSNSDGSISLYTIDSASNPSITASVSNYTCTVTFNVVVPNGVKIYQEPGTGIRHVKGEPTVGFKGRPYILPADVSFYNIEIKEGTVNGVGTGYFAYEKKPHPETEDWIPMLEAEEGYGTKVDAIDTIQGWSDNHTPYEDGTFLWAIPWVFHLNAGSNNMTTVNHLKTIDKTGKTTISKNSDDFSKELNDASSNY